MIAFGFLGHFDSSPIHSLFMQRNRKHNMLERKERQIIDFDNVNDIYRMDIFLNQNVVTALTNYLD